MRYLGTTVDYGIWLTVNTDTKVVGFSNTDWAECVDDRKSTSGGLFFVGSNLVASHNKKQTSTSLSIVEVEYIAAGRCCTQLLCMKHMLFDYGIEQESMTVFCDNKSIIDISKNPV